MSDRVALGLVALGAVCLGATAHASVWAPVRGGVADSGDLVAILALAFGGAFTAAVLAARVIPSVRLSWVAPRAVVVATLVSLLAISRVELRPPPPVDAAGVEQNEGRLGVRLRSDWRGPATRRQGEAEALDPVTAVSADRTWFLRGLMIVVGGIIVALIVVLRRPTRVEQVAAPDATWGDVTREEAHAVVISAIDGMLADSDPRTAIIGAYARLLEELETIGAARRVYEGPLEHLNRVLRRLSVSRGPVEELADLFAVARFSAHTLTDAHRDRAMAALRAVAGELSVPSPVGAPEGAAG